MLGTRKLAITMAVTTLAGLAIATGRPGPAQAATTSNRWLAAYYPAYRQDLMPPSAMDFSAITELIHWPAVPNTNGTLDTDTYGMSPEHSNDVVTRAHAAGVKVLLGVGADAASGATSGFRSATQPDTRATFVANIVSLMRSRSYDGVDINWEELSDADGPNFAAFIHALRTALNAVTPRPLLTIVPTTGDATPATLAAAVQTDVDQINLQTYVMSGAYPGWMTWFNSPLHNGGLEFACCPGTQVPSIDNELDRFENAGIPSTKLGLGMQFDAFIWSGGFGTDTGGVTKPRQSWLEPLGLSLFTPSVTVQRYADMVNTYTPENGYARYYDDTAEQPYRSYDSLIDSSDTFISYEDEQSIAAKATYLRTKHLGGAFIFEASGDYFPERAPGQQHPLLQAAHTSIKQGFVNTP